MYVTNVSYNVVSVINTSINQVVATIPEDIPSGITNDSGNREMYISDFGGNPGTVSVISTTLSTPPPHNNNTMSTGGFVDISVNSIDITGGANGGNGILNDIGSNGGHSGSATSTSGNK